MELAVGAILDGKITGITKFGAFVSLPEGKTGMVHISEVAHSYVNDIREHLKEGQDVKVKIIGIDDEGRVNLSIKKTQQQVSSRPPMGGNTINNDRRRPAFNANPVAYTRETKDSAMSFEDKLKHFMQDSESRMTDIKHNLDKKSGARRRK